MTMTIFPNLVISARKTSKSVYKGRIESENQKKNSVAKKGKVFGQTNYSSLSWIPIRDQKSLELFLATLVALHFTPVSE